MTEANATASDAPARAPKTRVYILPAAALAVAAGLTLYFTATLGLIISPDGQTYLHQAEILFTPAFYTDWVYWTIRTPLYPLLLKTAFALFGTNAYAAMSVQVLLGFLGGVLLAFLAHRFAGPVTAAIVLLLTALNPLLITYQHAILTEAGSFFFLAALLMALPREPRKKFRRHVALAAAIGAAAYYYRPAFLFIGFLFGFLVFLAAVLTRDPSTPWRTTLFRAITAFLVIGLVPMLASRPWVYLGERAKAGAFGEPAGEESSTTQVVSAYLVKQAVLPRDAPELGAHATAYSETLDATVAEHGGLPPHGLRWRDAKPLRPLDTEAEGLTLLAQSALRYPLRYTAAVARNMGLFLGLTGPESENRHFHEHAVTKAHQGVRVSKFSAHPEWQDRFREQFELDRPKSSVASSVLTTLYPWYEWLWRVGGVVSLAGFFAALWKRNVVALYLTGVPLGFAAMHSLLLLSMDRFAAPVQPVLIANVLLVPLALWPGSRNAK